MEDARTFVRLSTDPSKRTPSGWISTDDLQPLLAEVTWNCKEAPCLRRCGAKTPGVSEGSNVLTSGGRQHVVAPGLRLVVAFEGRIFPCVAH
eukprot:scaffold438_cov250-Pinguiococcus_pyrenoidosus.AAC.35